MENPVSEVKAQVSDDQTNFYGDQLEHKTQWHPFGDAGFLDAYVKSEAHLLLHFASRNSEQFIACIQRQRPLEDWRRVEDIANARSGGTGASLLNARFLAWSESAHRVYANHGQQDSVLVRIVEGVESPERLIPSLVWVENLYRFERILPKAGYKFVEKGWKVFGAGSYREFGIGVRSPLRAENETASSVIERAAQVMKRISSLQSDLLRDRGKIREIESDLVGLLIEFSSERTWLEIPERLIARGFKLVDVMFGPLQLG